MVRLIHRRIVFCSALILVLAPRLSSAKTIVCISGDNDVFTNSAEGYYRQRLPSPPAVFTVGGDSTALVNCISMAMPGDSLIIVAHGGPGRFNWGGKNYAGFSGGRGATGTGVTTVGGTRIYPIPLPSNFTQAGLDITVCMISCFSDVSPGTGAISTAQSLRNGIKEGNMVKAFTGQARVPTPFFRLTGGTAAQRNAAYACLINAAPNPGGGVTMQARVRLWLASFRPIGSGVTPNSQSKAEEAISMANCAAAGGAVTVMVDYGQPPFNQSPGGFVGLSPLDVDYDGEPDEEVSVAACELDPVPVVQSVTWGAIKTGRR